jgi:hypothetical protein
VEVHVLGLSEISGTGNHEPNITKTLHPTANSFPCKEDWHCANQDTATSGVSRDDDALGNLTQWVKTWIIVMEGNYMVSWPRAMTELFVFSG